MAIIAQKSLNWREILSENVQIPELLTMMLWLAFALPVLEFVVSEAVEGEKRELFVCETTERNGLFLFVLTETYP